MPIMDEIREHLSEVPFQPFALRTADGREYPVPTIDHVWLPPGGRSIVVSNDRGITVRLAPLLIAGIVFDLPTPRRRTGRRKS